MILRYLDIPHTTPDQLRQLFSAARAFYAARPWRVLSDADIVALEFPDNAVRYATVLGGAEISHGLVLWNDLAALRRVLTGVDPGTNDIEGDVVSCTFTAMADVPDALRTEREGHRWPLAGPAAYPLVFRRVSDGEPALGDASDLSMMAVALQALAQFTARHGGKLRTKLSVSGAESVRTAEGGTVVVRVSSLVPSEADAPIDSSPAMADVRGHGTFASADLERVRAAVMKLPDVRRTLNRLMWSFIQAPSFRGDPAERDDVLAKFIDWAFFGVKVEAGALAVQAVARMKNLDAATRARLERLVQNPRWGMFRVTDVRPGDGFDVVDTVTGDSLRVRERTGSRSIRPDFAVLGLLLPVDDGEYIMTGSQTVFPETPDLSGAQALENPADLMLLLQQAQGASPEWIGGCNAGELRSAYERFRDDMGGARSGLPTMGRFQKQLRAADMPLDVLRNLDMEWWTEQELDIFGAFLSAVWNVTPRAELNDRSPVMSGRGGPGPEERRLIEIALSEFSPPFDVADTDPAIMTDALHAFMEEWMDRPRDDLDGRTPGDVISEERDRRGR